MVCWKSRKAIASALIFLTAAKPVSAYLDPGSGSYILQMLLGVVFAGLFTLKIYGERRKGRLPSMFVGREDDRKAK